jgi:ribosome-binding factor A
MRRFNRADRLSEEIMKTVASIIREDLRDPRLGPMISITRAEVSKDLKYATIHVSIFGKEAEKKNAMAALTHAAGFVRSALAEKMRIRVLPEIRFKQDDSIEHSAKIAILLKKAAAERGPDKKEEENEE